VRADESANGSQLESPEKIRAIVASSFADLNVSMRANVSRTC
jgi:hypothetical protein